MEIISWCNRIIRYSFYLLFLIVPLILTPWNYELFEFNKMMVTYALTIGIGTAWIMKMALERKIAIRRTPLDIPIMLFVLSQLVSSFFSIDPHVSWFGYYSRFNGGMLSVFCYVFLYYAFVSNASFEHSAISRQHIIKLLYLMLGSATLVACYAILQRLGIDKHLWVQDVQNRVFSTLGQPNWLAAYLVALMPLALHFALYNKKHLSSIFGAFYVIFFMTLLFTKSRSGILALGITLLLYVGLKTVLRLWTKTAITIFLILHAIPAIFIFFHGSNIDQIDKYFTYNAIQQRMKTSPSHQATGDPAAGQSGGTLLEYGGTESGTIRKYVWDAAIAAWRSTQKTFFIGTGTETFAFAFFQHKPVGHNLTSEWDFLYNKAHNEYLNYLATTGIAGLFAYGVLLGVFVFWFFKHAHSEWFLAQKHTAKKTYEPFTTRHEQISLPLFAGWISILITNFFGFSVVIMQLFLFLFPAFLFATTKHAKKEIIIAIPRRAGQIISILGTIVGTVGILYVGSMWIGDYFFAKGYRLSRAGRLAEGYTNIIQATFFRPKEPLYYDELSVTLGSLAVASMEAGNATAASELATKSLTASDIALSISPNNVNFWKSRTKIYFGFADLDPKFIQAAKSSLEKAAALSPNDPKIAYNLAILEGRLGNNENAIELLKNTIAIKPNYRDAYYALYVFYTQVNQVELAKSVLGEYLKKVDPNDEELKDLAQ
jgi:O-antigen ligase/Flp pilus assembly protein TadD